MIPVALIAHGTRHPGGCTQLRALRAAVQAGLRQPVHLGVLEHPAQGLAQITEVLAQLAEDSRCQGSVRLVPLLLSPAGHASGDLGAVVRGARSQHPQVQWSCGPILRPGPALLAALGARLLHAELAAGARSDALLVAGRGSTVPRANARLARLVARPLHCLDGRPVAHAFASLAAPSVGDALEALHEAGARSVTVAPYLLNDGHIAQRISEAALDFASTCRGLRVVLAQPLGLHPAVIAYVRARATGERRAWLTPAVTHAPPRPAHPRPIVVAGTASGTGKTTVALGLMAALRRRGLRVQPFKVGPDYIDPLHHAAVAGRVSRNLDGVLCDPRSLPALAARAMAGADVAVVEGVLGLFDGRLGGGDSGSTAEVARLLDAVVVLVVDAARAARSTAAVALGFARFDQRLPIAGVVLNRVGGQRHAEAAREAVETAGIPVLGVLDRDDALTLPERYLGLVPPQERARSPAWVERLAAAAEGGLDIDGLLRLARRGEGPRPDPQHDPFAVAAQPLRARIAVASDAAFTFQYADALDLLRLRGAELVPFSPLRDRAVPDCGAMLIGGGFPERFAAALEANAVMRASIAAHLGAGVVAVAECGGAMYLGRHLTTEDGSRYAMCGVLPWGTRMAAARRALGYRTATALRASPLLGAGETVTGHEFHWSAPDPGIDAAAAAWSFAETGTRDGLAKPRLLASYLHLHLAGAPAVAARLVAAAEAAERATSLARR